MESIRRFVFSLSLLSLAGGNLLTAGSFLAHATTNNTQYSAPVDHELLQRKHKILQLRVYELSDYIRHREGIKPLHKSQQKQQLQKYENTNRTIWFLVNSGRLSNFSQCQESVKVGIRLHSLIHKAAYTATQSNSKINTISNKARFQLLLLEAVAHEEIELTDCAGEENFLPTLNTRQLEMHKLSARLLGDPGLINNDSLLYEMLDSANRETYRDGALQFGAGVASIFVYRWIFALSKVVAFTIGAGQLSYVGYGIKQSADDIRFMENPSTQERSKRLHQTEKLFDAKMTLLDYHHALDPFFKLRWEAKFEIVEELHKRISPQLERHGSPKKALNALCKELSSLELEIKSLNSVDLLPQQMIGENHPCHSL